MGSQKRNDPPGGDPGGSIGSAWGRTGGECADRNPLTSIVVADAAAADVVAEAVVHRNALAGRIGAEGGGGEHAGRDAVAQVAPLPAPLEALRIGIRRGGRDGGRDRQSGDRGRENLLHGISS